MPRVSREAAGGLPSINGSTSELHSLGGLAAQEKGLRISPFPTDLERSKVLVPKSFWSLGLGFAPKFQLIEVLDCDFSLAKSIEEMIPEGRREILPLNFRHLLPKRQAGQFLLDAPLLCSIGRSTQLVCQFKEPVFLSFLRLQPGLDELNKNSVRAGLLVLGQSLDPLGQARGQ